MPVVLDDVGRRVRASTPYRAAGCGGRAGDLSDDDRVSHKQLVAPTAAAADVPLD